MAEAMGTVYQKADSEAAEFTYELHPSGALVIWRAKGGEPDQVEVAYGPGAWIQVSGTQSRAR